LGWLTICCKNTTVDQKRKIGYNNSIVSKKELDMSNANEVSKFIVWVGGVADYEGDDLNQAKAVYKEWIAQNYDDVILEVVA